MKLTAVRPVSRVLARELAVTALLLAGVSVVVFAILALAPGDPLAALGVREAQGLPRTWPGQYAAWFGKMQMPCDYIMPVEFEGDRGVVQVA